MSARVVDGAPVSRLHRIAVVALGVACATALLIFDFGVIPAHASTASIATEGPGLTLRAGAHHHGAMHAGAYILDGHEMYCISYGAQSGDGAVHQGTTNPVAAYIITKWGTTNNGLQAADAYLAANSTVGNPAFDADLPGYEAQLPDRGARINAMIGEAKRLAGPWTIAVDAPQGLPGTSVTAHVTVTSASGNPAPAAVVTVRVVGGTAPTTATTDGSGVASVPVVPTALSYTLVASAQSPGTAVLTNTPSRGRQTLIGAGPLHAVTGTGCASVCPASASVTIDAPCKHGTAHSVTVTWTTVDLPGTVTGTLSVDGQSTTTALVRGGQTSASVTVPSGSTLKVGWSVGGVSDTLTTLTVGS